MQNFDTHPPGKRQTQKRKAPKSRGTREEHFLPWFLCFDGLLELAVCQLIAG